MADPWHPPVLYKGEIEAIGGQRWLLIYAPLDVVCDAVSRVLAIFPHEPQYPPRVTLERW